MLVLKHPATTRDFFTYQAMIVKASHDYKGTPWLSYDAEFLSQFNQQAGLPRIKLSGHSISAEGRQGSSVLLVGPYTQEPASTTHHDKNQHIEKRAELHPMSGQHQYAYVGIEMGTGVQTAPTDKCHRVHRACGCSETAQLTRLLQVSISPFEKKEVPLNSHPSPQTQ